MTYKEMDAAYKEWWKERTKEMDEGKVITSKPIGSGPIPDINNPRHRKTLARGYSHPIFIAGCKRAREDVAQWYEELFEIRAEYGLDFRDGAESLSDTDYIEYLNRRANLSRSYGTRKLCHPNQKGVVCYCT